MAVLKIIFLFSILIVCSNSEETTSQAPTPPEGIASRFFDLGGIINQLFPGFNPGNQGTPGLHPPGMDFPANSQYYPNAPIQGQDPQIQTGQGGSWPVIDDVSQYPNSRPGALPYPDQNNPGSYPQGINPTYPNQGGFNGMFPGISEGGLNPQLPPQDGFDRPTSPMFRQYPNQGSFMNQNPNQGYQIPSQGNQIPSQGNFMNQNPNQGNFMNQNPNQGNFMNQDPNQGNFMNQDPNQGNFMNQNPNQGNFMNQNPNQGNFMNQNPSQVNQIPSQGNFINQNPSQGAGGQIPFPQYPNTGAVQNQIPNQGGWNQGNFMPPATGGDGTLDGIKPPPGGNLWITDSPNNFGPVGSTPVPPAQPDDQLFPGNIEGGMSGGIGGDVIVPPTTPDPGRIFYPSSTNNPSLKQCVQDCETSTEYDPVCGSDDVTYINPGKFVCARNCGVNVFVVRTGRCFER